jgi:LuxR family maltose regulon positive regulatory protein
MVGSSAAEPEAGYLPSRVMVNESEGVSAARSRGTDASRPDAARRSSLSRSPRAPLDRNVAELTAPDSSGGSTEAATAIPLLETKLYIPRWRSGMVSRSGLIERIHVGAERRLTLVSAPPGFGKTTLLAEWYVHATAAGTIVGWVSLDPSENEPAFFLAYVIRALQKAHAGVGAHALSQVSAPQRPRMESILTSLINDIDAIDSEFVLVLDDYHVIDEPAVHDAVTFLLDHLPPRMHLVIASRTDPALPLPRLRARGELTELRPADLRFTSHEAGAFLNQVMALDLSAIDIAKLEQRTEGWIAGLKLAALSMQGRKDVRGFVDAFSGDFRYVADYLVEEVLQAQPERTRRFLLATAILDRLSGALCDAVTGEPGSQALLERLERSNLFVVALDDEREWYRYHHLFADVLKAQAVREHPDLVRAFHRRASVWYEHGGSRADAVGHAFAAEDLERAAALLETEWPAKNRSYESARWLERVKSLPDALVRARPVLSMGYAWGLLNAGELDAAATRLNDVERWLAAAPDAPERSELGAPATVLGQLRSLAAELASARVYLAQSRGDVSGTVEQAQRNLSLIPEGDLPGRATGTALLALAQWAGGELEAAYQTFSDALAAMRKGGHTLDVIRGTFVLGDLRVSQGRLHEAAGIYERGLHLAPDQIQPGALPEMDELHLGLCELHREWGDLEAALEPLRTITQAGERAAHRGNRQRWCTAMAGIRQAQGDLDGALELLLEAEARDVPGPVPRVRPIGALKARIWVAQGRLSEAMGWVRERGLSYDDDLSYLREFEHLTLARVLSARRDEYGGRSLREAVGLLERITVAAEAGGRTGSGIEALVLLALARQAQGDGRAAFASIERALNLAEPERYLRIFIDEGDPVREILLQATARGISGNALRRVLSGFDEPSHSAPTPGPAPVADSSQLLTPRELAILRLIAAGLRNQEIAKKLFISPATVKRHVANIYSKLGVGHRTEALVRARGLNLL